MAIYSTSSNSRDPYVTEIQQKLKAAGYDPGPIDGIFGPKTAAAVRAYQKDNGLVVDGVVGPKTIASFGDANAADSGSAGDTSSGDTSSTGVSATAGSGGEGADRTVAGGGEAYRVEGVGTVIVYELQIEGTDTTLQVVYAVSEDDLADFDLSNVTDRGSISEEAFDAKFPDSVDGGNAIELDGIEQDTFSEWFSDTLMEYTGYNRVALEDPEVMNVLVQALLDGATDEEFEAKLSTTQWAIETNEQGQQWDLAADVDRQAMIDDYTGRLAQAWRTAWGIVPALDDATLVDLATRVAKGEISYGNAVVEIQTAAGEDPATPEATRNRELNRRAVEIEKKRETLYDEGRSWGLKLSDKDLDKWATGINDLETDMTEADFENYLKDLAEVTFGSREAGTSNRGRDMSIEAWSSPYRASWAELLETSDDMDLVFDDRFMSHLKDGASVSEFRKAIRESDEWKGTDNARQQVSGTIAQLGQMMGY